MFSSLWVTNFEIKMTDFLYTHKVLGLTIASRPICSFIGRFARQPAPCFTCLSSYLYFPILCCAAFSYSPTESNCRQEAQPAPHWVHHMGHLTILNFLSSFLCHCHLFIIQSYMCAKKYWSHILRPCPPVLDNYVIRLISISDFNLKNQK